MNGPQWHAPYSFGLHCPRVLLWAAWVILTFCCCSATPAESPTRDADTAYAERVLRKAGVKIDGPSVLAFIRDHTLTEKDRDRLALMVRLLGASEYKKREDASRGLIEAGRSALPLLRRALKDPDLEIARRARRCIKEIQLSPTPFLISAAAQVVKDRCPPGATAVLLGYLPCIDEDTVEEAWFDVLRVIGLHEERPDPALVSALTDKRPIYRAVSAHVLGRSSAHEVRRCVVPLLADPDARVRYEAAASLVCFGETATIPVLTDLLTDAPLPIACQSEYLLCLIADGQGPAIGLSDGDVLTRRQCRKAWEAWWRKHAGRVDLTRLKCEKPPRGLTAICEYDGTQGGGRVWEWGLGGKPRWEIPRLEGPNDIQLLSGGRILIAERNANRVTERDHHGKVFWQHLTSDNPIACQRLPNGNTLVATFNELYEVTIDQRKILTCTDRMGFRHAVKLVKGGVAYITGNGQVVELDATWKRKVRTIRPANYSSGASYWASIEPLPNGCYLLALGGSSRVIEIDTAGKIHWEYAAPRPVFATRLRNGHTLVSCFEGRYVLEVDRTGKEVSKQTLRGRPFTVRRY